MKDNRKIIQVLTILTIIFTIMGGSLAYWTWQSDSSTKVTFSVGSNFSCSVDGGGNINQTSANEYIAPATCTNEDYAIKRKVVVTPSITKNDLTISMDLWLDIDNLGTGLSDSYNFKYVLSTSESSCEGTNIVNSGTFHGKSKDDTVVLLDRKTFTGTTATSQTYWLYIWLDKNETSDSTMNQPFSFSLNGSCTDNPGNVPNAPVLDPAMVPVTIADNGDVTTVSETDPTWYDYENKEWANVVLVKEEGINDRQYYLDNPNQQVEEEDILAYYVWIPRYKYRIPSRVDKVTTCGSLENPTPDKYPGCYSYTMSDGDKVEFQSFLWSIDWTARYGFDSGVGILEDMLETGMILRNDEFGVGYINTGIPLINFVNEYNSYEDGEYEGGLGLFTKEGDITLKGETFVGDRIYNHEKSTTPVSIDISFEDKNDSMVKGDAINTYYSHPGFVYNGETLSGIWVSKFEVPIDKVADDTCYDKYDLDDWYVNENGDCVSNYEFAFDKIVPNYDTFSPICEYYGSDDYELCVSAFNGNLKIASNENIFGLNSSLINSHSSTDSEYGAISYLTHSKYGINTNIENNNTMMTGGGTYGTLSSYTQSTTGNISGIFDLFGGNNEVINVGTYESEDHRLLTYCNDGVCYGEALDETNKWYDSNIYRLSDYYYNSFVHAMCSRDGLFSKECYATESAFGFIFNESDVAGTYRVVLVNK